MADAPWVFGTWLVGALIFFREQWDSGFRWLMGNDGDTRLAAYLCEHWFRVFHGQASWLNPGFFYPVKGLLGWSDTYLLYQIFYGPLRLLGCDPFLALQVTVIMLSLVGFVSFVYLVRLAFDTPLIAALLCGCMFTFSNALWLHSSSAQLSGIYFVPAIMLVALIGWRALRAGHRTRALVLAGSAGLLWALLLYSTYYVGWFATMALGLTSVLAFALGGRSQMTRVASAAKSARAWFCCMAAGVVAGLIPFARTYLPARHPTSYALVMRAYGPHPRMLLTVGSRNLLWGRLVSLVDKATLPSGAYEISYAVTPVVMLLTFAAGLLAVWLLLSNPRSKRGRPRMTVALAATAFLCLVLPVNTRFGSLWALVWHLPGASAIRGIDRIQLITGLAATLAIAASARDAAGLVGGWKRGRALQVAGLALLAIAVVEQVNTARNSDINQPAQVHIVDSIKAAPSDCRVFAVVNTTGQLAPVEYQIDAMIVSQKLSLPTVNGYTGYFPPGWGLLRPWLPNYAASVSDWAREHHLTSGMCSLDLATMRWHAGI